MAEQLVRTERRDAVAIVRLDRPPLNAMSAELLAQLAGEARGLSSDTSVRAVVVAGSDRAFAAGADIDELERREPRDIAASFREAFDAVAAIPRPVIAAVRGVALGGGLELALSCDLRVAAESARLGQPETQLGIIPGAGATQRLTRLVGPARAKDLIFSGRHVRGREALDLGLVDRAVPSDDVEPVALEWASMLAAGATAAMALAKGAIDGGLDRALAAGLDLERDAFIEVLRTADARAGIRSFLEHGPGKATFEGG